MLPEFAGESDLVSTDREVDEAGGGLGPQLGVADHGGEEEQVAGDGGEDDG